MTELDWHPDDAGDLENDDPWMGIWYDGAVGWCWAKWGADGDSTAYGEGLESAAAAKEAAQKWADMQIKWYQCDPRDCEGDTWIADETDTMPAFSVWLDDDGTGWNWTAWRDDGFPNEEWDFAYPSQQAAMSAAQSWLDARPVPRP